MDRVIVNHVKNPFDPFSSREIIEFPQGVTVSEILTAIGSDADPLPVISINGQVLSENADLSAIRPTGAVVICTPPEGGGGGGKNILRVVAMLAVIVTAQVWAMPVAVGLSAAIGVTGPLAMSLASGLIMGAGSLLVNALIPANVADVSGGSASDYSKSPTYGWEVSGNTEAEAVAWPVLYGTHRITPPVIGKYVEVIEDKQYLNILYAIADHRIDSIDKTSVEINGNPVTAGSDDVTWEIRLGDIDQPVIQYFNDTRYSKSVGMKIGTDWTTVQTDGIAVEGLGIALTLPKGLYYAADSGELEEQTVSIDIEYCTAGTGVWRRLEYYDTTTRTITADRWSAGFVNGDSYCEVMQGSTDPADHVEGEAYTPSAGDQAKMEKDLPRWPRGRQARARKRVVWEWRWVTSADTDIQVLNTLASEYVDISGSKSEAIRRVYYQDRLAPGCYDIRVRFHDGVAPPDTSRYANDVYLDYVEEIVYDDFTYPGTALFALRALATDKLSGSMPVVTLIAARSTVPVWTGAAWADKPANNPAWASWDALYNGDYGGGAGCARITYADFDSWATYCASKGYACNLYADSTTTLRKVLDMLGQLGEGTPAQVGGMFACFVDREVSNPVQSFIFNAGNTMRDSYEEEYLSLEDRANVVEVTFWDAANSHKRTTIEVTAPDYDETSQEIKKTSLSLVGCTSYDQAVKHGRRAINRNRYLTRTASWDAGIDSLGCLPWDPVVPPIGRDGRVVSATADTVTIDREVILQPGHTYKIRVQNAADDTVEEKTVAAVLVETPTDTLAVTTGWTHVPDQYELYILYEEGQDRGLMRVVRITRKDDHTRRITAIEYNALACDDTGTMAAPEAPATMVGTSHLRAVEVWKGAEGSAVQLSWTGFAVLWIVWRRRSNESQWTFCANTLHPSMTIFGLDCGMEYTFCVSHTRNPADGETVTLTPMGTLLTAPGEVEDVAVEDVSTDVSIGGAVTCTVRVSWTDRPTGERVIDYDVIYRETEES